MAILHSHGEQCYICNEHLLFREAEVEHLIPQRIFEDQAELFSTLEFHDLPSDFDLNGFHNLRTAHSSCNKSKGAKFYRSGFVSMALKNGEKNAERAAKWYENRSNSRVIGIVEGLLEIAEELGFSEESVGALNSFITLSNQTTASISMLRPADKQGQPIVWNAGQVVHGPFGQGIFFPSSDPRFDPCPACGVDIRGGIRCAWCGNVDD